MSSTNPEAALPGAAASSQRKITFPALRDKKQAQAPITALTAYDYPTARLVDEAGIDLILVGDSLGMVVLGYESTLPVTLDEMLHHTRAVRRAVRRALLVADMPFGSYEIDPAEGLRNALRLVKEGGAQAVKIEGGGAERADLVRRLTAAEIPVMGHLGLTPQAVHRMGGYRVQGRTLEAAGLLLVEALALEAAGASALVLEGVPREVAERVTAALAIPTIGIGAGPGCDGQILVFHDLVGLAGPGLKPEAGPDPAPNTAQPKFVRAYADLSSVLREAIAGYARDVLAGHFPSDAESYHLDRTIRQAYEDATLPAATDRRRHRP